MLLLYIEELNFFGNTFVLVLDEVIGLMKNLGQMIMDGQTNEKYNYNTNETL